MVFGRFKRDRSGPLVDLANAPVGAPVTVDGKRGVIMGTTLMSEAGDRWIEHLVQDQSGRRNWVSIENFSRTEATLWEDVEILAVNGGPTDNNVTYQGRTFTRNESGTVTFESKGDVDMFDRGSLDYVDYRAPDGTRFSFERYGEEGAGRRSGAVGGNCPNCGAQLQLDAMGRCSSCGSEVMAEHGWWGQWEAAVGRDVSDSAGLQ